MNRKNKFLIFLLTACCMTPGSHASSSAATRLYRNSNLNIEFSLPPGWEVRSCQYGDKEVKCIALWPRSRRRQTDPAIFIELKKGNLEEAASGHVLFEKTSTGWVKHGRFNDSQSVPVSGPNWKGIEASASCGISDETGFHAAAGECYTAILSNGNRSAIIETDGFEATIDSAVIIMKSFRFSK